MNKIKINHYKLSFLALFSITSILMFLLTLNAYPSNKWVYIFFSIISFILLFYSFNKFSFFFEKFFSVYLWLGFWFKFSIIIILSKDNNYKFTEGVSVIDVEKYFDKSLVIAAYFFMFLLVLIFFRVKLFELFREYLENKHKNEFLFKTQKIENIIFFIFIIFCILISILNFYYQIFQKGTISSKNISFMIALIIKWFFLIGFPAIISIFLFNKIKNLKSNFFTPILISLTLIFTYNVSLLSRAIIFDFMSILYGVYIQANKKIFLEKKKFFFIFSFSCLLFVSSIVIINDIRLDRNIIQSEIKSDIKEKMIFHSNEFRVLIVNRFVGIDSLLNISQSQNLSLSLFIDSLNNKIKNNDKGFYERKFLKINTKVNEQHKKNSNIIVPGIIAYLYYTGSILLVLLFFLPIYILIIFIEFITLKFSNNNLILASVIGNILAYRLIHFGYMPQNTYQLIIGVMLAIFIYPTIKRIFSARI